MSETTFSVYQGLGEPVAIGAETYNQILQHYYTEALLLDNMKLQEWGSMLAEDLVYTVPMRHTLDLASQSKTVIRTVMHMDDNYRSIMGRIMRLCGRSAWAENPPSRIRRFVSNVQVFNTDNSDEFSVINYAMVSRNRFDDDFFDLIPCERHDKLRKVDNGFKLFEREVIFDQALLGTPNLQIFL